jgi:hypothetical protein
MVTTVKTKNPITMNINPDTEIINEVTFLLCYTVSRTIQKMYFMIR